MSTDLYEFSPQLFHSKLGSPSCWLADYLRNTRVTGSPKYNLECGEISAPNWPAVDGRRVRDLVRAHPRVCFGAKELRTHRVRRHPPERNPTRRDSVFHAQRTIRVGEGTPVLGAHGSRTGHVADLAGDVDLC